jgi:alpha-L-fucosidase 2
MSDLELWYDAPAAVWTEALPIGNGRLGAMVFGGVGQERLQLNEETLWAGGPYSPANPEALRHLEDVRQLLFAQRYAEAEALSDQYLMGRPFKQMPYQPAADLWIDSSPAGAIEPASYRRSLDLAQAVATTRFGVDGVTIAREAFATTVDGIIAVRLRADRAGALAFRLRLTSLQPGATGVPGEGRLRFTGRNRPAYGVEGQLAFAVEARLTGDGQIRHAADAISFANGTEALILIDAATSFRRFDDVSGEPLPLITARLDAAGQRSYAALRDRHTADYGALFGRLSLRLDSTPATELSTDRRIAANPAAPEPALAALFVQYGRYLMLASSRPGTQPATLQGIWNDLLEPPWGSKYTCNINLQMNYWLPDVANLGECMEPLLRLLEDVAQTGQETARVHYAAPGWVLHHNTDLWRATAPIDGAKWGLWPTGGAWLCSQLWDHVRYGNWALAERLYPVITALSLSPENVHPHGAALCYGPAMDAQIVRDLFDAVIEAGEHLGRDPALRARLAGLRARLPEDRIGKSGQLQEWLADWDMDAPELHHRHVSHLYALYPSQQISLAATPKLAEAARRSLDIRGDDATGWGIGWRINLWARLRDGERAHRIVQRLLSPERTYPNMFDAHPPFQIDGNFGGAAGILEMLVQSDKDDILLLPALPSAWPQGRLAGVRARGGAELTIEWREGRLVAAILASTTGRTVTVRYGSDHTVCRLEPGRLTRIVIRDGRLAETAHIG